MTTNPLPGSMEDELRDLIAEAKYESPYDKCGVLMQDIVDSEYMPQFRRFIHQAINQAETRARGEGAQIALALSDTPELRKVIERSEKMIAMLPVLKDIQKMGVSRRKKWLKDFDDETIAEVVASLQPIQEEQDER